LYSNSLLIAFIEFWVLVNFCCSGTVGFI
jgi:hypothetical protein